MRRMTTMGIAAAITATGLLLPGVWNTAETRAQTPPAASVPVSLTGTWNIDPAHTNVNFAIRHLGISTVRGRFDDVKGTIVADAANPEKSSVDVTIRTASIDTDVKMRDDHLRTEDFLDAEKYPEITFRSTRIEKGTNGGFVAHGNLTMHGVTKEVALPFSVAGPIPDAHTGSRVGAETQVRLNRQDFGIKYGQVLDNGVLALGNDVDVTISLEAVPPKPAAPAQ